MDGESDSDYSDEEQYLSDTEDGKVQPGNWDDSSTILPRQYSEYDLNPTDKDPRCNPDWKLSTFWPVFVGNFRVEEWNPQACLSQISNYFGYKGLLTRMIVFPRQEPGVFATYQKNCLLRDMLVYFTSKEDSERAIKTCHQDSYYGFKLNVLPGRTPLFYDNSRSILFTKVGCELPQEYNIVRVLSKFGAIDYAARFPEEDVIVEFSTAEGMLCALQNQMKWTPKRMTQETMKQRFVEATSMDDINEAMQSNSAFMEMRPSGVVLQGLYEGKRPIVSTAWMNHKRYLKTSFTKACRKYRPRYRNRKKKPDRLPKSQREKLNIYNANLILKRYGISPISRDSVRESMRKAHQDHLAKLRMARKQRAFDKERAGPNNKMNANNKPGTKPTKGKQNTKGQKHNNDQKHAYRPNKSKKKQKKSKNFETKAVQPPADFKAHYGNQLQIKKERPDSNYSEEYYGDGRAGRNCEDPHFRMNQRSDYQGDRKTDFSREHFKQERPTFHLAEGSTSGFQTNNFPNVGSRFEQSKSKSFVDRKFNFQRDDTLMERGSGENRTFGYQNNDVAKERMRSDHFEHRSANAYQNAGRSTSYHREDQTLQFLRGNAGIDNRGRSMQNSNQSTGFGGYGSRLDLGAGIGRVRNDHTQMGTPSSNQYGDSFRREDSRMENARHGQYDDRSSEFRREDHTFNSRMAYDRNRYTWRRNDGVDQSSSSR